MTDTTSTSSQEILTSIEEQVEELCHSHDHITRIIKHLNLDEDWFDGYDDPARAKYDLTPTIRLFLYKYTRELSQSEVARKLNNSGHLYIRFGFDNPIQQQSISHNERNRFTLSDRRLLKDAGKVIRYVCREHDVIRTGAPKLEPEDVQHEQVSEEEIIEATERATKLGFSEFDANRASNASYPLEAYFERQGYLNMSSAGTTSKSRRFARLSERESVPHGSSHNRTMKKVATPESQLTFNEFVNGRPVPEWKRIRDAVLEPFHAGVENILSELTDEEYDEAGFTEPVHAAIDITDWPYWVSPYLSEEEARLSEKDPIRVTIDGEKKFIDPEHPELVSGVKNSGERGYKFATITIVAEKTPIVLGIVPVRDQRNWERKAGMDVERTSRADIVRQLLEQASQHVDIHKVFLDRGFSSKETRDVIDRRGLLYVLGKPAKAEVDKKNIQEIKDKDIYDSRLGYDTHEYDGREHDITYVYKPSDEAEKTYAVFTINEHVDHHRADALISQYGHRMEIENEYKTIKKHFLPTSASKDFRIRFLYFVIGTLLHNVWRMANFILRDLVDRHLGEHPPIPGGELIELVGFFLFDPPD